MLLNQLSRALYENRSTQKTNLQLHNDIERERLSEKKLEERYNVVDYLSLSGRPVKLNGPHMTSFNGASISYVEGFMAAVIPTMTAGIP